MPHSLPLALADGYEPVTCRIHCRWLWRRVMNYLHVAFIAAGFSQRMKKLLLHIFRPLKQTAMNCLHVAFIAVGFSQRTKK